MFAGMVKYPCAPAAIASRLSCPINIGLRDHQASPLLTIFEINVVIRSDCCEFRRAWLHLAVKTCGGKKSVLRMKM